MALVAESYHPGDSTRHRRLPLSPAAPRTVCKFWVQGRCARRPCAFLHGGDPQPSGGVCHQPPRGGRCSAAARNLVWRNPNVPVRSAVSPPRPAADGSSGPEKKMKTAAEDKIAPPDAIQAGDATPAEEGDAKCPSPRGGENLGESGRKAPLSIKLLGSLRGGHTKDITGIALPADLNNFVFTGSADGTVRVWENLINCDGDGGLGERKPTQVIRLGSPVSCLIATGCWVFAGARGSVQACNTVSKKGLTLSGPAGQVSSLATSDDALFAGVDDGSILAWRGIAHPDGDRFEPARRLSGHTSAVTSLAIGGGRLYSGGEDGSIRAWGVRSIDGVHELDTVPAAHAGAVTSLLCWFDFLLSASLDGTVKLWEVATKDGQERLQLIHTHREEQGVVLLAGSGVRDEGPVLLCSLSDGAIRLYGLPAFSSMGTIPCAGPARAMLVADGVFVGDASGEIRRWSIAALA